MDPIWKDIMSNVLINNWSNVNLTIVASALDLSNNQYDHLIVLGNPNSRDENYILNYISRNNVFIYYMGYMSDVVDVLKYVKYHGLFIFNEGYNRSNNLRLMEIQRYVGSDKVSLISNPMLCMTFPTITNRITYRYGMIISDSTSIESKLLENSNLTELYIGVMNEDDYDPVENYCLNRGFNNTTIYIITSTDAFFKAFSSCERLICDVEYVPLAEAAGIIPSGSEMHNYSMRRLQRISSSNVMDFNTILVTLSNNIDRYTNLALFHKLEGEYKLYHKREGDNKKIMTSIPLYSHLSQDGGVLLIDNLPNLFVNNTEISLTYSLIPIHKPWIAIMNEYDDKLLNDVWFQRSLPTCMGFICYSKIISNVIQQKMTNSYMGLYASIPIQLMTPSIRMSKHNSKHHNKIIAVDGIKTSIFDYNKLQGYEKYYYGFKLPDVIPTANNEISNIFSQAYPSIVYNVLKPDQSPVRDDRFWKIHKDISSCKAIDSYHEADVLYTRLHDDDYYSYILIYAIIHHVPIIINKTKLSEEYLGPNYPLYVTNPNPIASIHAAKEYLSNLQLPYPIGLEDTDIYKKLY